MHFCFRSACVLFVAIPPAPCCWHCTTPTTTAPCYRWDAGFVARSRVGPRRIVRVELWQPARRQRPSQLWAGRGRHNQLPSWCAGWVRPWGVTCVPLALAFSNCASRLYVFMYLVWLSLTDWSLECRRVFPVRREITLAPATYGLLAYSRKTNRRKANPWLPRFAML